MSITEMDERGHAVAHPSWADIQSQVNRVFTCEHAHTDLVYKETADNRKTYRRQCRICGWAGQVLRRDSLTESERAEAAVHDETIRTRWYEARQAYHQGLTTAAREREQAEWWAWYNEYLSSDAWQARRDQVLHRAAGLCEGCMSAPAQQVHHLTYERAGDELLFDLVAVCRDCHQRAHPHKRINTSFPGVA